MNLVGKTVNLNLVGMDGNAFYLLGAFAKQAKKEGWNQEEIDKVTKEAQSGDYDHLIVTLLEHSNVDEFEPEDFDEDTDDEDEEEEVNSDDNYGGAY